MSGKELGESWVIVGPCGTVISLTNASSEYAAWQSLPQYDHTTAERQRVIDEHKAEGFTAVKVKIVKAEDYEALLEEAEEYRKLKEKTKNLWIAGFRQIMEGAKK
jgi:hypothetical protein